MFPGRGKSLLYCLPQLVSLPSGKKGSTSTDGLGKWQKVNTKYKVIEMTKLESCRQEVTFQSLSTVGCRESSFCFPSDSGLNVISAVSLPHSGDDGAWQYGSPPGTHVKGRNVPSQQQALCLHRAWGNGHSALGFPYHLRRNKPSVGRSAQIQATVLFSE